MKMLFPYPISLLLFFGALLSPAYAKSNFITVHLPLGISIDIPRNWEILNNDQLITLDTTVESQLDLSRLQKDTSNLSFAAYHSDGNIEDAKVIVRYYPNTQVFQEEIRKYGSKEIQEFDNAIKQSIFNAAKLSGDTILSWGGTRKQDISDHAALITEYRRPPFSGQQGSVTVQLFRVFDGTKTFSITISYNDLRAVIYRPICERIVSTIRIRN